ncbi:MAG: transposase [Elusimicrobiota bacterium]
MARGVDGRDIFMNDGDRRAFLSSLDRVKRQVNANIFAYCLMGNHFHLAVKVATVNLAAVMHRILTSYVLPFNSRHNRTGHLFQARYKSKLCLSDRYLTALIRYIHLNPVRAGFCARPEDWEWSSYREYQSSDRDGLMGAEEDYPDFDPWENGAEERLPNLTRSIDEAAQTLTTLRATIATQAGIADEELASGSRRHDVVIAKRRLIVEAVRGGHRLSDIAQCLGLTPGAMTYYLRKSC